MFFVAWLIGIVLLQKLDKEKPADPEAEAEADRNRPPPLPMGAYTVAALLLKDKQHGRL